MGNFRNNYTWKCSKYGQIPWTGWRITLRDNKMGKMHTRKMQTGGKKLQARLWWIHETEECSK